MAVLPSHLAGLIPPSSLRDFGLSVLFVLLSLPSALLLFARFTLAGPLLSNPKRSHPASPSGDDPASSAAPLLPPDAPPSDEPHLLDRLGTLTQAVGTARNLATVFRALQQFVVSCVPCNAIFISRYDSEQQARVCVYAWAEGVEEDVSTLPSLPMTDSPNSRSVATGQIIVTDDLEAALAGLPRVDVGLATDPRLPRSSIAVPMVVLGRTIGGFEVQSVEPAVYTPEHAITLRLAANLAAIAIENVQGLERERDLRQLAEQSEAALRASEERYRAFVERSREGIWRYELDEPFTPNSSEAEQIEHIFAHGYLAECNDAMAQMYGYARAADLIGTRLTDLQPPTEPANIEFLRTFIRSGYRLQDVESRERDMHGNEKVFLNSLIGVVEAGVLVRAWGTQRDVTQRTRAETALRVLAEVGTAVTTTAFDAVTISDNLTRLVVPILADYSLILMLDEEGKPQQVVGAHVDPAQASLIGDLERLYTYDMQRPNSVVGRAFRSGKTVWSNHIPDDLVPMLIEDAALLGLNRTLDPQAYVAVPLTARDRTLGVWVLVFSVSGRQYADADIALSEELARRAALAMDNARLYEQAQEAVRTRDQFISIASHDLKTPVTSIKGYADLLARRAARAENMDPRDMRAIGIIQEEAGRLNQLIELLLDVSRFQRGQLIIDRSQVNLCRLAARLVLITQATTEQHTVELQCPNDLPVVWGDGPRLEQVLQNLLQNAVKYSPQGGSVRLRVEQQDAGVVLSVSDEGIGIPPDAQPHLFTRFYRASNTQPLSIGGLGLGLYIVRQIVEAHDGTIAVTSELGVGSTFTVTLPLDPRQQPR